MLFMHAILDTKQPEKRREELLSAHVRVDFIEEAKLEYKSIRLGGL